MPNLSKVRAETRFVLKWGSILAILFLVVYLGMVIKEKIIPTPLPPPTVSFGKLPAIEFPKSQEVKDAKYVIDTLTGKLLELPDRVKVYKIDPGKVDFLSLDRAQEKVSLLGFKNQKSFVSENTYQWVDRGIKLRQISYNISSSNFVFSTSFLTDATIGQNNLAQPDQAIATAKSFLKSLSSFPEDLDETQTKTSLYAIKNYTIVPGDQSTAQIIRVDFPQKNINSLPMRYPNSHHSTIYALIAGGQNPEVVEASFQYKNVSNDYATYPIFTSSQAFDMLQEGKAYVLSYFGTENEILIKNVFLAYYIEEKEQKYLMPIVVFEGDDDFVAYVSAIKDEWINN